MTKQLRAYKGLDPRWHDWSAVTGVSGELADGLLRVVEDQS